MVSISGAVDDGEYQEYFQRLPAMRTQFDAMRPGEASRYLRA
jgi:hypothetical protein